MNFKWKIFFLYFIEGLVVIVCTNKRKHKNHHIQGSQSSIPNSLTSPIVEENYNPEESMCIWKDDLENIYNLSLLQKTDSYWEVDLRTTEQQSFKIQLLFNFCKNFPKMPCQQKSLKEDTQNQQSNKNYGAYQTLTFKNHQSMDSCSAFGQYDKSLIELIDYYEVGQGIKIVYKGGEICSQSENPKDENKEKSITFLVYCSSEKDKDENFTSMPIDGISVTSCNPTLTINHPGGCYQGQMNAQKHQFSHPLLIFLLILTLILLITVIIILTLFNCLENGMKGFMAFPYYEDFKHYIQQNISNSSSSQIQSSPSFLHEGIINQPELSEQSYKTV